MRSTSFVLLVRAKLVAQVLNTCVATPIFHRSLWIREHLSENDGESSEASWCLEISVLTWFLWNLFKYRINFSLSRHAGGSSSRVRCVFNEHNQTEKDPRNSSWKMNYPDIRFSLGWLSTQFGSNSSPSSTNGSRLSELVFYYSFYLRPVPSYVDRECSFLLSLLLFGAWLHKEPLLALVGVAIDVQWTTSTKCALISPAVHWNPCPVICCCRDHSRRVKSRSQCIQLQAVCVVNV